MTKLSPETGSLLPRLARRAIREALGAPKAPHPLSTTPAQLPATTELERIGASFVTLYRGDLLHGCIGSLEAHSRLCDDVEHNAVAAALRDPRAVPLTLSDVAKLTVEVSVLSPLERVPCTDEESAIAALRPYEDGVVLRHGRRQGTFLPQVWQSLPDPRDFLAELRYKARLPPGFWARDLEVYRYGVQKFIENPE